MRVVIPLWSGSLRHDEYRALAMGVMVIRALEGLDNGTARTSSTSNVDRGSELGWPPPRNAAYNSWNCHAAGGAYRFFCSIGEGAGAKGMLCLRRPQRNRYPIGSIRSTREHGLEGWELRCC